MKRYNIFLKRGYAHSVYLGEIKAESAKEAYQKALVKYKKHVRPGHNDKLSAWPVAYCGTPCQDKYP
jgi:hypothetical protein